ncbi:hypothetical protein NDU88_003731 [Pleurodeles waltl]|uniref:Uncharacterized protein n=1 Tax=Pleurodeles waltl TaxID=8319 RepID=A0AAV7MUA5_PLEWA|nr:hypothetical protein NDU88_003731 [Pleurodeles waltl]
MAVGPEACRSRDQCRTKGSGQRRCDLRRFRMPEPPLLLLGAVRDAEHGADATGTGTELVGETRLDEMAIEQETCTRERGVCRRYSRDQCWTGESGLRPSSTPDTGTPSACDVQCGTKRSIEIA